MSWEVQFRKSEAELDLKLSSFQNLSPENDSVQLEAEIETLLNKLNSIVKEQDQNPKVSRKILAGVFFYRASGLNLNRNFSGRIAQINSTS